LILILSEKAELRVPYDSYLINMNPEPLLVQEEHEGLTLQTESASSDGSDSGHSLTDEEQSSDIECM
jgi:hypothetical protein